MALQAFNLIHQKLDSEKLIEILRFGTNDYSGAFGDIEPGFENDTLTVPANTQLLVGGQLIMVDSQVSYTYSNTNNYILVLALDIEADKNSTNITTNIINKWCVGYLSGSSLELNTSTNTYRIKYGESTLCDDYHYQTIYSNSISISSLDVSNIGNEGSNVTKGYIIPLLGKYNNEVVDLLGYKTGYELEEFLTKKAIEKLTSDLDEKYTHQRGAILSSPENINAGSVGNLNVDRRRILSTNNNIVHVVSNIQLANQSTTMGDVVGFAESRFGEESPSDSATTLHLNKVSSYSDRKKYYKYGDTFVQNVITPDRVLMTDGQNIVTTGIPGVEQGGTGATTKFLARANLGIFRGTSSPEYYFNQPERQRYKDNLKPGDVYFKIVT